MMKEGDVLLLLEIVAEVSAKEIMPRYLRHQRRVLRTKASQIDFVTAADIAVEAAVAQRIRDLWPDADIVGEEGCPNLAEASSRLRKARLAVVIDPIDGTGNFVAGLPLFATMLGVVVDGQTVAGLIYDPVTDECTYAVRGCGAWIANAKYRAKHRLRVQRPSGLATMRGTASLGGVPDCDRAAILSRLGRVGLFSSYRCAGHELKAVASGNLHFAMYSELRPWDHAMGALIVQEAGGFVSLIDGRRYEPAIVSGTLLAASDHETWMALRSHVFTDTLA